MSDEAKTIALIIAATLELLSRAQSYLAKVHELQASGGATPEALAALLDEIKANSTVIQAS